MPRPRDPGAKVWGPSEQSDGRFRVTTRARDGARRSRTFATRRRADAYVEAFLEEERDRPSSLAEARGRYEQHLIAKGNKVNSISLTVGRIARLLAPLDMLDPEAIDKAKVRAAYQDYILHGRVTQRELAARKAGIEVRVVERKPLAADTHRNALIEARSFFAWMVEREWIASNPLEEVKGQGKRRHGKVQLRVDEARRFDRLALERARDLRHPGSDGACAALIALYMGLRASEIINLRVRDVDDRGTLLWIEDDGGDTLKTEKARRKVEIPDPIREALLLRTRGHGGDALLFPAELVVDGKHVIGPHDRGWPRKQIGKLCAAVGVPRVTAHGMRNVVPTLSADRGVIGRVVAEALGHEDYSTTMQSYMPKGKAEEAIRRKGVSVLTDEGDEASD